MPPYYVENEACHRDSVGTEIGARLARRISTENSASEADFRTRWSFSRSREHFSEIRR